MQRNGKLSRISALWCVSQEVLMCIERWINRTDRKFPRLRYKPQDMARLTVLKVWSLRHRLTIDEILTILVPILRGWTKGQGQRYGLGVSIRTLTSKKVEAILKEKIGRLYPQGEHIARWRSLERDRQLRAEVQLELDGLQPRDHTRLEIQDVESIGPAVQRYIRAVMKKREQNAREEARAWRRLKPYRQNPWL